MHSLTHSSSHVVVDDGVRSKELKTSRFVPLIPLHDFLTQHAAVGPL